MSNLKTIPNYQEYRHLKHSDTIRNFFKWKSEQDGRRKPINIDELVKYADEPDNCVDEQSVLTIKED